MVFMRARSTGSAPLCSAQPPRNSAPTTMDTKARPETPTLYVYRSVTATAGCVEHPNQGRPRHVRPAPLRCADVRSVGQFRVIARSGLARLFRLREWKL